MAAAERAFAISLDSQPCLLLVLVPVAMYLGFWRLVVDETTLQEL